MKLLLPSQLKQVFSIQPAKERLKTEKLIGYRNILRTTKKSVKFRDLLVSKCAHTLLKLLCVLILLSKLFVKKSFPTYKKEQILVIGFRQSRLLNSHYGLEDIS